MCQRCARPGHSKLVICLCQSLRNVETCGNKDGRLLEKFVEWKLKFQQSILKEMLPEKGKHVLQGPYVQEPQTVKLRK